MLIVPYHLDQRLEEFYVPSLGDHEVVADLPEDGPWQRMAVLYEQLARAIAEENAPAVVVSGDCTASLGVLAGLQRAGRDVGIVWFDAHADFHTEATTTSGYLGGMPLALAAGVGTLTLPLALGLRPVPESWIVLVDARDTDPGEHALLARSAVRHTRADQLDVAALPQGSLYLHFDIDVCDPAEVPGLAYPVPDGPSVATLMHTIEMIRATGRLAGVGIAATWQPDGAGPTARRALVRMIRQAIEG